MFSGSNSNTYTSDMVIELIAQLQINNLKPQDIFKQKEKHLKNMRKQRSKNGHTLPSVVQTKDTTLFHPKFSPLQSVIVEDLPNPVLRRRDTTAPLTHPLEVSKKHHLDNESGLVKLWRNTSRMRVLSSNGGKKMTC